jgi:hypothetical protein
MGYWEGIRRGTRQALVRVDEAGAVCATCSKPLIAGGVVLSEHGRALSSAVPERDRPAPRLGESRARSDGRPSCSQSQGGNPLSAAKVWVGLKNSDDVGIRFDLRAEVYANGTLVASGQEQCAWR